MTKYEQELAKKIAQNTGKRKANKYATRLDEEEVIYMITEKGQRTVKVGYTNNLAKRLNNYRTHSTCFEVLDVKPGTREDEEYYQSWLEGLGFTKHYDWGGAEWYDLPDGLPKATIKDGFKAIENLIHEVAKQLREA